VGRLKDGFGTGEHFGRGSGGSELNILDRLQMQEGLNITLHEVRKEFFYRNFY
jgi:hypothetical protein